MEVCRDYTAPVIIKRCQLQTEYGSTGGDSGAPVFVYLGNGTVSLVGVHVAGGDSLRYASPVSGVHRDFGITFQYR
jgi:hypothetical protein